MALSTELLSRNEVAALLGVKVNTLAHWAHKGTGPTFIKLSRGKVAYPSSKLAQFLSTLPTGGGAATAKPGAGV
jgi:predicted DNA-binding transcriptional regulator AlpA